MTIFQNSNYRLSFIEDQETITFHWEEGHVSMDFEAFKEACSNFLGYGFEYQAKNILIDVRNFQLTLPAEFPAWQKEEHYPRYYKLGIQRVAYLMPEAALVHAKTIEKEDGTFELRNFARPDLALNWLKKGLVVAA